MSSLIVKKPRSIWVEKTDITLCIREDRTDGNCRRAEELNNQDDWQSSPVFDRNNQNLEYTHFFHNFADISSRTEHSITGSTSALF